MLGGVTLEALVKILVSIQPDQLEKLDKWASANGINRASAIRYIVAQFLKENE